LLKDGTSYKLSLDPSAVPSYSLKDVKDGLIRYKNRVWIGAAPDIHHKLIQALDALDFGGHSGIPVTYQRMKHIFTWKGMKQDIANFVKSCQICI
jgi:hypothetical protein